MRSPAANKPNSEKPVAPPPAPVVDQPVAAAPLASGPPPGWSVAGKAAFDALPDAVKADIAKREEEISEGFAKLADYKGLDPWVEMARNNGRTLPEVVAAVCRSRESAFGRLRRWNPFAVPDVQRRSGTARSVSRQAGKQQGDQQRRSPPTTFAPVLNRLNSVDQRLQQWERQMEERENAAVQSELQRFAADPTQPLLRECPADDGSDHRRQSAASLSDAYDQACWMNPEIRALLISERRRRTPRNPGARRIRPAARRQPSQRLAAPGRKPGRRASTHLARGTRTSVRGRPHLT